MHLSPLSLLVTDERIGKTHLPCTNYCDNASSAPLHAVTIETAKITSTHWLPVLRFKYM